MTPATFEQIISFENLLKAHKRARLGKQHKKEIIEFELNLSKNLWALHYDLKYHKYKTKKITFEELQTSLASYKGHLLRGNGWGIFEKIALSIYLKTPLLSSHAL